MWKYKGGGFIPGIPARDLTEAEFNGFSKEDQDAIRDSGLYELDKPAPKKPGNKTPQEA